jgi:hypothetical protein
MGDRVTIVAPSRACARFGLVIGRRRGYTPEDITELDAGADRLRLLESAVC